MNLFRVNTSAWNEEDFFLVTNLTEAEIEIVLAPIVQHEREEYEKNEDSVLLPNEEYCNALQKAYPTAYIKMYNVDSETLLQF